MLDRVDTAGTARRLRTRFAVYLFWTSKHGWDFDFET
jgi:hypothetical protein